MPNVGVGQYFRIDGDKRHIKDPCGRDNHLVRRISVE